MSSYFIAEISFWPQLIFKGILLQTKH